MVPLSIVLPGADVTGVTQLATDARAPARRMSQVLAPPRWMLRVLGVYGASRVFTLSLYLAAYALHSGVPRVATSSFGAFLARSWDSHWYHMIATIGYPSQLPTDTAGNVLFSPWAFYPGFPVSAQLVCAVTGLSWNFVAPTLSMVFAAAAMLVLYRLICDAAPELVRERPTVPLWAVAAMSFFPTAAVYTMAYSESLALLLLLGILWLIVRHHYLWTIPLVIGLGLTRGIALPIAAVLVWHAANRWWAARQGRAGAVRRSEWCSIAAATVAAVAAGLLWQLVAAVSLGRTDAYWHAQTAWRAPPMTTAPFSGWTWMIASPVGVIGFTAFCVAVISWTFIPATRAFGPELQAWAGAYTGYLVATTVLGTSTPRYALLTVLLPLSLVVWLRRSWSRALCLTVLAILQAGWVWVTMLGGAAP